MLPNQTEALTGSVAKILSTHELIINRGSIHMVREGMLFKIMRTNGEKILDPETKEVLGIIRRPKGWVVVTSVYEKMCIATTSIQDNYTTGSLRAGTFGASIVPNSSKLIQTLLAPGGWSSANNSLELEAEHSTGVSWVDEESKVRVGDKVVAVEDIESESADMISSQ